MVLHLVLAYFNLFHILGLYDGTPDFSDNRLDAGHDGRSAIDPEGWLQYDPEWVDGAEGYVEPSVERNAEELDFWGGEIPKMPACGLATSAWWWWLVA